MELEHAISSSKVNKFFFRVLQDDDPIDLYYFEFLLKNRYPEYLHYYKKLVLLK